MHTQLFLSIIVLFSAITFQGCIFLAAGAAGVGTAKWLSDKVTQEVDVPSDKVASAAKNAMKDMGLEVYKETKAPEVTQILARYTDGRKVWVDIKPLSTNNTQVDVRVGWMDGETQSREILEKIVSKSKSWF